MGEWIFRGLLLIVGVPMHCENPTSGTLASAKVRLKAKLISDATDIPQEKHRTLLLCFAAISGNNQRNRRQSLHPIACAVFSVLFLHQGVVNVNYLDVIQCLLPRPRTLPSPLCLRFTRNIHAIVNHDFEGLIFKNTWLGMQIIIPFSRTFVCAFSFYHGRELML